MSRGGRPLSDKSVAIVTALRELATPLTYTQVAERLQLARRDALVTCDRLAASGHLMEVGKSAAAGRRAATLYAAPPAAEDPAPAITVLWL